MSAEGAPRGARKRYWPLALGALAVIVVGSVAFATLHGSGTGKPGSLSSSTGESAASTEPLQFVSASPAKAANGVDFGAPITLTFSTPLAPNTPLPTIAPAVAGSWQVSGASLTFTPTGFYTPSASETVSVPAAVRSAGGNELGTAVQTAFTVKPGSIRRLQQLLAELDYLPVSFAPAGEGPATTRAAAALGAEPTDPTLIPLDPVTGAFAWRFASIPSQLASNWNEGLWNVVTQGAVMAFQADHNLTLDGEPGPLVWHALLTAVANRAASSKPYDYLIVSETLPETLYVWRNGGVAFQTPVNTGVSAAATPLGTWPVYLRFTSTTMRGTNPDGTKYADPGVPWVSYFHGSDAVHGFWRSGYGYPQSVGCVEVPINAAATVFPYDPLGTLVTVTTGNLSSELGVSGPVMDTPPVPPNSVPVSPTTTTTAPHPTTTVPVRHTPKPTTTTASTTTTAPTTTTSSTVPPSTSTTVPPTTASTTSGPPTTPPTT